MSGAATGAAAVRIRPAADADAPALARLSGELGYPATAAETAERLAAILPRADHVVLVAERAGMVIGWAHAFLAEHLESAPFTELGGLVVSASARGVRVGERLVEEVARWGAAHGRVRLRVRSNVVRAAAHRFYERLGFHRIKDQAVFEREG